jgi:hypothetical protein
MGAGFQADVERRACRGLARFPQRDHFRVIASRSLVAAFAHDAAVVDHDGADERIRRRKPKSPAGQRETLTHKISVNTCKRHCSS